MRSRPLRVDTRDGVRTLTLDRPEHRNALDGELREALSEALDAAARDTQTNAIVITGAGGAFCAGGDLGSFEALHDARVYRHVSHDLTTLMDALERFEKPTIAAIDGVVTGAGGRAPLSYGAAKRLLPLAADSDLRSTITAESPTQTGLLATDDHREGLAAARERREPAFTGH